MVPAEAAEEVVLERRADHSRRSRCPEGKYYSWGKLNQCHHLHIYHHLRNLVGRCRTDWYTC